MLNCHVHRGITCTPFSPQLMSVVSFERYQKELTDVRNPGVLAVPLGQDQQCYNTRTARSSGPYSTEYMFYLMLITMGILFPPVLLRITWRKQLAVLEQVKVTKGGPAVMWACIAWMPIATSQ